MRGHLQLGDVESDDPDLWSVKSDLGGESLLDAALRPPGTELLAVLGELPNDLCDARIAGVLGCDIVKLGEEVVAAIFSPGGGGRRGALCEIESHEVAAPGGERAWIPEAVEGLVPGNEVEVDVEQARRCGFHGQKQAGELWVDITGHLVIFEHWESGEATQVAVGLVVESQRPGDGVDHLDARHPGLALFEARVPGDADAGSCSDLFSAKPWGVAP